MCHWARGQDTGQCGDMGPLGEGRGSHNDVGSPGGVRGSSRSHRESLRGTQGYIGVPGWILGAPGGCGLSQAILGVDRYLWVGGGYLGVLGYFGASPLTRRAKGPGRSSRRVLLWYLRISCSARWPGRRPGDRDSRDRDASVATSTSGGKMRGTWETGGDRWTHGGQGWTGR